MEMIDDFISMIKTLIKGYHKYGMAHRFSRAKERIKSGNSKANSKINDYGSKIMNWIKAEIKK